MSKFLNLAKKYTDPLINTRAAGIYILAFAAAIGIATFIENDFGTSSAQKVVYQAWWFTGLLVLFGASIIANIFRFRMIQQKKWALMTFHLAIIVILIGAGATRYFGYEGIMHIRENGTSDRFLTAETYLQFEVKKDGRTYAFDELVLFATLGNNKWNESYLLGNDLIEVNVERFIPNPQPKLVNRPEGSPILKIVFGGTQGREEYFIAQGQKRMIRQTFFNFTPVEIPGAINLGYQKGELIIKSDQPLVQTVMASQRRDTLPPSKKYHPLKLRSLYSNSSGSFVFGDFKEKGIVQVTSEDDKVTSKSMTCLKLEVAINGEAREMYVYGMKGLFGKPSRSAIAGLDISVAYGAKYVPLPFAIKLYDFIMERYPGTNNAASYASEVQLIDSRTQLKKDYRIYMNHILDHDGYRFFQSSFDKDEQGTYLSVNHDRLGSWISYFGYFLLTLGMFLSFFSKKSRFSKVAEKLKVMRGKNELAFSLALLLCFFSYNGKAEKVIDQTHSLSNVTQYHANKFSQLVVQDHRGRMKPFHTLSREILRKLCRKESLMGLSADQIVLSMFANSREWTGVPMIKLGSHEKLKQKLNTAEKLVAYKDFFNTEGQYILKEDVRKAYGMEARDRSVYEKELMKVDERVNIMNMVFSGHMFKLIPEPGDPNNSWASSGHSGRQHNHDHDHGVAQRFFGTYTPALQKAIADKDYGYVNSIVDELDQYQQANGGSILPSDFQVRAEIFLNEMNVFTRLSFFYLMLGMAFLFFLFYSVFKPGKNLKRVYQVLFGLVILGFAFHTLGLGLRWYVSGRAPWSNGYESMIYIAWTTTLAGVIFTRRSFGGLAATMVLASTILLVALLSYMDPEITPLVPVLRSYWLTIHVSLEAGSYGFLMLGALIGLINLILIIFLTAQNKDRIYRMVKEMSYLSEMTLIGGVFMISVGTYLGGIWANESWGRYWGWDAKETWALVTILVYAFILHMRIIPKMQSLYAYNFATIFGLASVIMTYYGVNYYLSGLHSYAAGDPLPIPQWVYMVASGIVIISILAYWKKWKYNLTT